MSPSHRVAVISLNLRSEPEVRPGNRIAVLGEGHPVTIKAPAAVADWSEIETSLNGVLVSGFVSSRYLEPIGAAPPAGTANAVTAVHLAEGRASITRAAASGRAYPIGEPGRPPKLAGNAASRAAGLLAIIDWLDVETGGRWKPGAQTYCNIYAYDVCCLVGVYLPRVFWTADALLKLGRGENVVVEWDRTVTELNANALCNWLERYGPDFGWRRSFDPDQLQMAANAGQVAIISAHHVNANSSGHIQVIAPEHGANLAKRTAGHVSQPLQSQAGRRNFRYGFLGPTWWAGASFRKFGFWISA